MINHRFYRIATKTQHASNAFVVSLKKAPLWSGEREISIIFSRLSSQMRASFRAETFLPPTFPYGTTFSLKSSREKSPAPLSPCRQLFRFTTLWNVEAHPPPSSWSRETFHHGFFDKGEGACVVVQTSNRRGRQFTLRKKRWKLAVQSSRPTHLPRDWLGKVLGDSFTLQIGGWNRHQKTFSLAFPLVTFSRADPYLFFFFFFCYFSSLSIVWLIFDKWNGISVKKGQRVVWIIICEKLLSSDFFDNLDFCEFLIGIEERVWILLVDLQGRSRGYIWLIFDKWREWNLFRFEIWWFVEKEDRVVWVVCIILQSFLINWIFVTEVEERVRIFFI